MYKFYIDGVMYPLPPQKFQVKINNRNETITLVNDGEVNRLKSPGLTDISVSDLVLPSSEYPFANYGKTGFQKPSVYLSQLEKLKTKKKIFKVVLIRMLNSKKMGWNTSMTCTLEDYTIDEDATSGSDVTLSLTFKEWVSYGTKTVKFKKSAGSKKKTVKKTTKTKRKPKPVTYSFYTVKRGDCLWNIAKKKLGKATRWKEIYKLNKSVIESTAKKHGLRSSSNGHWIYPGTKLKLPKK